MSLLPRHTFCLALSTVLLAPRMVAGDDVGDAEQITIIGQREQRHSEGATGLALSVFDTPQSVSQIDADWLQAFATDDINNMLRLATGVNVEEVETDRTYYNSRGFDIKSMQVDGIGLPFNWNVVGMLDTAMFEKVEIIRGANGLLTGTGNPSGTINYVRKRPTSTFNATAQVTMGSWNKKRVEADVSTPISDDHAWAARMVVAAQENDSHLDLYHHQRELIYGIVDGQLGSNTTIAIGSTQQDSESEGVLWGALPLIYGNGEQTEFDTNSSTSMDWTYWDTHNKTHFIEFNVALPADWQLKTVFTYSDYDEPSELFYVYASPSLDQESGLGLYGYPGKYWQRSKRKLFDSTLTGQFEFAGQVHDVQLGVNIAKADHDYLSYDAPFSDPAWGALPAFPGWHGDEVVRPAFGSEVVSADWQDDVKRLYAISRWRVGIDWQIVAGFNAIDTKTKGYSFGESMGSSANEISPYIGATYAISRTQNIYFSYSDIYEPQAEMNSNQQPIGSAVGHSYEAGAKSMWFNDTLLTSLSLFRAEQQNYAAYAGFDADLGISYYAGVDVDSEGLELEASGRIGEQWQVLAGFTDVELRDANGDPARTFVPQQSFNFAVRFAPKQMSGLEVGASLRWQDETFIDTALGRIAQAAYATVNFFTRYNITEPLTLALNIDNMTDKKYLTSLYWDQAFYGAPRHTSVSLNYSF